MHDPRGDLLKQRLGDAENVLLIGGHGATIMSWMAGKSRACAKKIIKKWGRILRKPALYLPLFLT